MSKGKLLEGLRELERCEKPRSAAAQLREIEPEILALLKAGYTLKQVWDALRAGGLDVTFSAFKSAL